MIILLLILFALIMGSFITMVVYRLPLMLHGKLFGNKPISLCYPIRSYCPQCQTTIPWYGNIPLAGFLLLRGKCVFCKKKIALQYVLIEVISLIMAIILLLTHALNLQTMGLLILGWALLTLAAIDVQHQILPDQITLPFLWLGLLLNSFGLYVTPSYAIWGAAFGYTLLWVIYELFWLLRGKEGLGFGDFKLLALIGAWGGWSVILPTLLLASMLGLLCNLPLLAGKQYQRTIAFGPYLAVCAWFLLLFPELQTFFYVL